MTNLDMTIAAPELLLVAVGLLGVLLGAIIGDKVSSVSRIIAAASLAGAAVLSALQVNDGVLTAFNGLYQTTPFIAFAKTVAFAMGAGALLMAGGYLKREGLERYEYALLAVFAALGMGVMLSANNLMSLYMGVECLSLSSYVMAAFNRDSRRSAEAGLKYFVLGALASGLLLFGASLVYGYTGSADYAGIAQAEMSIGLTFGLVLMLIGLAFKASAAPFHVWTPDVYEGAPTPVVAFFATAPKIAAVALFAHVLFNVFGAFEDSWKDIVGIVAALSMVIGAVGALGQSNIKRLLAYSSIANVGFALIGVAAGEELGAAAVLVYMTIYVASTLGIFGGVLAMRRREGMVEDISDLNGMIRHRPGIAVGMTLLIFSVAGIPPLAGFFGKWMVFQAALQADLLWLVIVGVVASVVSLGYYLRIVWAMMVEPAEAKLEPADGAVAMTVYGATALAFPIFVVWIGTLMRLAETAAAAG